MLNIISFELSEVDKSNIKTVFGFTDLKESDYRIVDLKHEDLNLDTYNIVFVIGKYSIRKTMKSLISNGVLSQSIFTGKDIMDIENNFVLITINLDPQELMMSQENKSFMWEKAQQVATYYKQIDPNVPFGVKNDLTMAKVDEDLIKEDPDNAAMLADEPRIMSEASKTIAPEKNKVVIEDATYDIKEVLNALVDKVKLSDPSLTKALAKYEKMTLHTTNGDLNVYPTTRIPHDEDGFFITLKDLIIMLKFATITDTDSLTISKEKDK